MMSVSDAMMSGFSGMTSLALSGIPVTKTPDEITVGFE